MTNDARAAVIAGDQLEVGDIIEDPNGVVFNSDNEESLLEYIEQWYIDNNCNEH